jgi:hypothetical protein
MRDKETVVTGIDDIGHYREHGWYVADPVLPLDLVSSARDLIARITESPRDGAMPEALREFLRWEPPAPRPTRLNQYIAAQYSLIGTLALHEGIGRIAALLTGAREIRLFNSALIAKQPGPAARYATVGWHCDQAYWPTCSSRNMITAWIPLQDTSVESGTLTVLDGSHRWPETEQVRSFRRARSFGADVSGGLDVLAHGGVEVSPVPLELKAGQVSFHHPLLLHGSGANQCGTDRFAISVHLQDETNRFTTEAAEDGTVPTYVHDRFVRRLPTGEPDYADPEICPLLWSATGEKALDDRC